VPFLRAIDDVRTSLKRQVRPHITKKDYRRDVNLQFAKHPVISLESIKSTFFDKFLLFLDKKVKNFFGGSKIMIIFAPKLIIV